MIIYYTENISIKKENYNKVYSLTFLSCFI